MDALVNDAWPGNVRERENVIERALIPRVLDRCGWRISGEGKAAPVLGLRPSTLRSRMQKLGIRRPACRQPPHR